MDAPSSTVRPHDRRSLLASETIAESAGIPAIAYVRKGEPGRPVVVALPGGGHLARIYYGHPGGQAQNFLDHWLAQRGFGLIALSYPSDHPAFGCRCTELTVSQWGQAAAGIAAEIIRTRGFSGPTVVVGWSMAGRACRAFNVAADQHGLRTLGFISLAATPPMPTMGQSEPGGPPFTTDGFWKTANEAGEETLSARNASYLEDIHWKGEGREPNLISAADYATYYLVNTPTRLRGEPNQRAGLPRNSLLDTIADLGTFNFAEYPFTGAIAPTLASDARHVLTDHATWGFLNSQKLYFLCAAHMPWIADDGTWNGTWDRTWSRTWANLRELAAQLPARLSRQVEGGHFFFVGRDGAAQTAAHIADLCTQLEDLNVILTQLLGAAPQQSK